MNFPFHCITLFWLWRQKVMNKPETINMQLCQTVLSLFITIKHWYLWSSTIAILHAHDMLIYLLYNILYVTKLPILHVEFIHNKLSISTILGFILYFHSSGLPSFHVIFRSLQIWIETSTKMYKPFLQVQVQLQSTSTSTSTKYKFLVWHMKFVLNEVLSAIFASLPTVEKNRSDVYTCILKSKRWQYYLSRILYCVLH